MGSRKKPRLEGDEVTISDLSGHEIQTVSGHAVERYENLRAVLCMLYPLRRNGAVPAAATTTIRGAEWQKERGSRADDMQAAHTMPRRLMINERSVTEWIASAVKNHPELKFAIGNIEGTVTTLPSYVNKADTRWENAGLSAAYATAAQEVLRAAPRDYTEAQTHYEGVWKRFHQGASNALMNAQTGASGDIASVLGKYQVTHGNEGSDSGKLLVKYYWENLFD